MAIIQDIEEGVKKSGCEHVIIENRREAIGMPWSMPRKTT